MTISTTASRAQYNGNGVTTVFSFPYLFFANGDLEVRLIAASGASTVLTLTTDYTVTGARNDAGGSVTMIVAPASGEQLLIRRIMDLTQETAYPSGGDFPAQSHEDALDKLTMLVQQHDEEFARTLQLPPESDVDASTINVEAVEVVAGIAADVSAVAAIDDEVVIAADNIAAILAAPAEAAAAAASALAADASADAAAASAASVTLPLPTTSGGSGSNYANVAALFNGIKQAASETATGVVEMATTTEASTGTDTTRAVTAAGVEAHMNANELGWSQTWQDVTGSRVVNTNYTNSTGRPIVAVASVPVGTGAVAGWTVGGVGDFGRITNGANASFNAQTLAIIPAGTVYQLTGNTAPSTWYELR